MLRTLATPTIVLALLVISCSDQVAEAGTGQTPTAAGARTGPSELNTAKASGSSIQVNSVFTDLTISDAELTEKTKSATDAEIGRWMAGFRTSGLPAEYVVPDWLNGIQDREKARAAFNENYSGLIRKMKESGRMEVVRSEPAQVRRMLLDEKYVNAL